MIARPVFSIGRRIGLHGKKHGVAPMWGVDVKGPQHLPRFMIAKLKPPSWNGPHGKENGAANSKAWGAS